MHPHSLETARALIRSGTLAVFSFDVFDTTLLRQCPGPDGVFGHAFRLAPVPDDKTALMESYCQQRQLAESKLRAEAVEKQKSPELSIKDIYKRFPTTIFGIERDRWQELADAEFLAECDLCFINPDILALIKQAQQAGIKVGFLSDTYWSGDQLSRLLRHCAPDLEWDFLYASCDHQTGKTENLFAKMLADQKVQPQRVAHMGDNEAADVRSARKAGIQAVPYPQATADLGMIFQREVTAFKLLCSDSGHPVRSDGGSRTIRRKIAATGPGNASDAFNYGLNVLGPVMATFDRFVHDKVSALRQKSGKTVAVAFLARDGLLPLEIWRSLRQEPASYCEINRRIALIGGSVDVEPAQAFFRRVSLLNHEIVTNFLKHDTPALAKYFKECPGGRSSGADLADALPTLLTDTDMATIAASLRQGVLSHLRATIPDFDRCTDIALVDLGYSGTVQKALRTILDLENCPQRLHGLYLVTADEALHSLNENDSAEGLISDAIITPHNKRALLNNIALLEQLCSAPQGSVHSYEPNGNVQREEDPRSPTQLEFCATVRSGAIHYARCQHDLTGYPTPFSDMNRAATWAATTLARALILPTDMELALLGGLRHDINMGTQALAPMADAQAARNFIAAKPLPNACGPHEPPMWLAASMAAISPIHGLLYALNCGGNLPGDIAGELPCGEAEVTLISGSSGIPLKVSCLRNGFGDFRMRIPFLRKSMVSAVVIPAGTLPQQGTIASITFQAGNVVKEAMRTQFIDMLPIDQCQAIGGDLSCGTYSHWEQDGVLVIPVPVPNKDIAVVTITIALASNERILA